MELREEMERSGRWLFRWRSYLPLLVIALFLLALREYRYPAGDKRLDMMWELACLAVSFLGLGIRVYTVGCTPKGTSGRNTRKQVAETLNTTGAYSVVRNPLYLGNFFMGLGIGMFPRLWWLVLIYVLIFWLYYERIILAEEAYLRDRFGEEFLSWARVTPVFIPAFGLYRKPALRFSLRNVLKREFNGFFAVIVVLFLLEVAGDLVGERKFEVDLMWGLLVGAAFAVWVTLLTLKKYTRLLNVEGR